MARHRKMRVEQLEDRRMLAVDFDLLKDINANAANSSAEDLVSVGSTCFFSANDGIHGRELWKTDGTETGTVLVKDIEVGSGDGFPDYLTAIDETVYFVADDGTGRELWKSDGTEDGTVKVKDINPGINGASIFGISAINNTLYFGAHDAELWKSDGTEAGTVLVKEFTSNSAYDPYPGGFIEAGGTIFFGVESGGLGSELWKTDGTEAGTVLVKDIRTGSGSSRIQNLTVVGDTLFFSANDGATSIEVWKSDGTTAGTVLVKDIHPPGSGNSSLPTDFENVGGILYLQATDGENGQELWKSDGTEAGTVMVKDIRTGSGGSFPVAQPVFSLTNVSGTLFFAANDGSSGLELWKSDGTEAGTVFVKDINPGPNGAGSFFGMTNIDGTLYFTANDGTHGVELWKSDGTDPGTELVEDFAVGSGSSDPFRMIPNNGKLFVRATTASYGSEIWVADLSEPPSADFDLDGDVDGRDFLRWQRGQSPNPLSSGDLALWQGQYGESGELRAESREPELGSRLRGNDEPESSPGRSLAVSRAREDSSDVRTPFEDSYVEKVDRAFDQLATVPSGVRSFGEMVARRSLKRNVSPPTITS